VRNSVDSSKDVSIWKEGHQDRVFPIGKISAKNLKVLARLSEVKLADELPETGAKQTLSTLGNVESVSSMFENGDAKPSTSRK